MQHLQGKHVCASCGYDYTQLKDSKEELDKVLIANLKDGPFGQLMALELHRRVTLMPNTESIAYVRALAESNGVKLPEPKKKGPGLFGWFNRYGDKG